MFKIQNSDERMASIEKKFIRYEFPPNVLIEATAFCNINCIQCANSDLTRKKGYMDIKLYKKIVDEVANENPNIAFWFAFYGEPLLLKYKLFYMIRYAKEKGLKNTYINTNGMLLDDEVADMLLDSGVDHIIVGIDGYSVEVFEKIRMKAKRDIVYDNVVNFISKMKARNLNKPIVEVQFIEMEDNTHEIEEYKKFWSEQGVRIKIRSRVSWMGHIDAGKNIQSELSRIACGWAVGTCPITWDGNMVACGTDCDGEIVIGNICNNSIKELWNGVRKEFLDHHFNHEFDKLPVLCQNCQDWQVIGTLNFDESGNAYDK